MTRHDVVDHEVVDDVLPMAVRAWAVPDLDPSEEQFEPDAALVRRVERRYPAEALAFDTDPDDLRAHNPCGWTTRNATPPSTPPM